MAFWQLLYPWLANSIVARAVQLSLIFHTVASNTPPTWISALLASGATASACMTVPVGRLFNHWGPGPINRVATLFGLSATAGLFLLPLDFKHIYCSMLIWILAGQSILFTTIGTYRGVGGIFTEQKRLIAFARMGIFSNLSDIVIPLVIGWLFYLNHNLIPAIAAGLAVTAFCIPQPRISDITTRKHSMASSSLLTNLKTVLTNRFVAMAIVVGAGIHSLLFICDLIIPVTGNAFNLTSKQVGTLLAILAFSQATASAYLSVRTLPPNTLFKHFLNGLFLGSLGLLSAYTTEGFASLLATTAIIGLGFGMIQPLSMSLIYHYITASSVGDAVSIRFLLNSLGRIFAPMLLALALSIMTSTTFLTTMGSVLVLIAILLRLMI